MNLRKGVWRFGLLVLLEARITYQQSFASPRRAPV